MSVTIRLHGTLEELEQCKKIMYDKYDVILDSGPHQEQGHTDYCHYYYCRDIEGQPVMKKDQE